jgi:hypothetical protein
LLTDCATKQFSLLPAGPREIAGAVGLAPAFYGRRELHRVSRNHGKP